MFSIIPQNHMVRSRKEHENFQSEIQTSIDVLPKYPACFPSDHCLSIEYIIVASCSLFLSLYELVAYWIRFVRFLPEIYEIGSCGLTKIIWFLRLSWICACERILYGEQKVCFELLIVLPMSGLRCHNWAGNNGSRIGVHMSLYSRKF